MMTDLFHCAECGRKRTRDAGQWLHVWVDTGIVPRRPVETVVCPLCWVKKQGRVLPPACTPELHRIMAEEKKAKGIPMARTKKKPEATRQPRADVAARIGMLFSRLRDLCDKAGIVDNQDDGVPAALRQQVSAHLEAARSKYVELAASGWEPGKKKRGLDVGDAVKVKPEVLEKMQLTMWSGPLCVEKVADGYVHVLSASAADMMPSRMVFRRRELEAGE